MKPLLLILVLFSLILILNSFISDNPFNYIDSRDVEFKVPKGFPKPVYDFNKNNITADGFVLGRKIFYDPILSKDSSTSCSSCHQKFAAFAHVDHSLSHGIHGLIGKRNVASLQNLVWKDEFMADGGINNLDLQPIAPITSPLEMGETLENVIRKLQSDSVYPPMFKKAFGDTVVTTERLMKSLSQFLALMISNNSLYDKYIDGREKLTDQELNGLKIFRSRCSTCHAEPMFTDYTYRNIGLKPDTALNDSGRASITGKKSDYMKFKVPTLRNIEMTYPYMHDGRFNSLEEVMDHYSNGIFFTENVDPGIVNMIKLTPSEKIDIIVFLRTLTDRTFLYDRRFFDPNIVRN